MIFRQSKKSETLEFFFGLNLHERYHDGLFFYNGDRLIKMYVKEGTLLAKHEMWVRKSYYSNTERKFKKNPILPPFCLYVGLEIIYM